MSKLGIITALPIEAYSLGSGWVAVSRAEQIEDNVWLYVSGIGAHNTCAGMQELAKLGIKRIVNWGVVAALDMSVQSGDIHLPAKITDGINTLPTDTSWYRSIYTNLEKKQCTLHAGTLISVAHPLSTPRQKHILAQSTHALSADMEAYALAALAAKINIELLVVKAVADDINTALPNCVIEYTDHYGRPRLTRFILEIMQRPGQIPELFKLALCFKRAMQSLCLVRKELLHHGFCVMP